MSLKDKTLPRNPKNSNNAPQKNAMLNHQYLDFINIRVYHRNVIENAAKKNMFPGRVKRRIPYMFSSHAKSSKFCVRFQIISVACALILSAVAVASMFSPEMIDKEACAPRAALEACI